MRKRKWLGVLLTAMALIPQATPAAAHDSWWISNVVVANVPGQDFCVQANGWQNHANHWLGTTTYKEDCWTRRVLPEQSLYHRGEWFFGGRFCFQVGWSANRGWEGSELWTNVPADLGHHGCHNWGQWNWLTMDNWAAAVIRGPRVGLDNWQPNVNGNPGVRPITWHCHCP